MTEYTKYVRSLTLQLRRSDVNPRPPVDANSKSRLACSIGLDGLLPRRAVDDVLGSRLEALNAQDEVAGLVRGVQDEVEILGRVGSCFGNENTGIRRVA